MRPEDDGYPEDWVVTGKSNLYYYPNGQEPAMLWYHDHAMGINRLNIFAGLLGSYIVRDQVEDRFRILNGSNARTYRLSFGDDITFHQIGTDQGLLPSPVPLKKLILAPAERADPVFDFSEHKGQRIIFKSDSFSIMQFRVSPNKVRDESSLPSKLRAVPKLKESDAVKTRMLTLNEYMNPAGESALMLLNGTYWHQPITEKPVINTTEIWSLVNPTDDTHPIHIHLIKFQILDRKQYIPGYPSDTDTSNLKTFGDAIPPDPSEAGWKDTGPRRTTRDYAHHYSLRGL